MPNQALWPKDVSPVNPTSMLSPSTAMARHTTCVAVLVLRPATRTAKGRAMSAATPIQSIRFFSRRISFKLVDTLAEEAARPEHEDEEHQHVHRRLARRRGEVDGDAAHHSDQQRGEHHAPE